MHYYISKCWKKWKRTQRKDADYHITDWSTLCTEYTHITRCNVYMYVTCWHLVSDYFHTHCHQSKFFEHSGISSNTDTKQHKQCIYRGEAWILVHTPTLKAKVRALLAEKSMWKSSSIASWYKWVGYPKGSLKKKKKEKKVF